MIRTGNHWQLLEYHRPLHEQEEYMIAIFELAGSAS
jgi:hypothetical protein